MADIFISYARNDRRIAEQLAAALERQGFTVWWDRHIQGGAEFSADIERELDSAGAVIVAWSASANESPWVKDEAAVARDQGKLVPISLDRSLPPLGFRQYHAIDYSGWKGIPDAAEFAQLTQAVAARMRAAPPDSGTATAPKVPPRDPRRKAKLITLSALLALLAALVAATLFRGSAETGAPGAASSRFEHESAAPRVAVRPIKVRDGKEELTGLGAALSEDIASGLARFSYLQVASGTVEPTGEEEHVAYLLEGSLRRVGPTLRLTAQLFKTASGEQVWGETYDRDYEATPLLALQDDLTDHVVASVADSYGALMRDLAAPVVLMSPEEMTPYQAVLRHTVYRQRIGSDDHLLTRNALELAAERAPGNADVRAALAGIYCEEHKHGYNVLPDSLDRALATARRAVELEPDNAYANFILGEVYYFRQDLGAFKAAAERAIELNPRDSDSMAMIGILMGYGGDWERSVELTTRAMALNPKHPGWYRFNTYFNEFRQGHFEAALDIAQRINMPAYFADPYVRAIAHANLGHVRQAELAAQEFLALWPNEDLEIFKDEHLGRWLYAQPELIQAVITGLQRAGLEIE